jgi:hypothetical protein
MMQLLFGLLYVLSLAWATPIDLPSSTIDLSAAAAQGTGMPVVPTDLGEPVDGSHSSRSYQAASNKQKFIPAIPIEDLFINRP